MEKLGGEQNIYQLILKVEKEFEYRDFLVGQSIFVGYFFCELLVRGVFDFVLNNIIEVDGNFIVKNIIGFGYRLMKIKQELREKFFCWLDFIGEKCVIGNVQGEKLKFYLVVGFCML